MPVAEFTRRTQRAVLLCEGFDVRGRGLAEVGTQPGGTQIGPENIRLQQRPVRGRKTVDRAPVTPLDGLVYALEEFALLVDLGRSNDR